MSHRLKPHRRAALPATTDSAHDPAHADRVYRNALTITGDTPVDADVLISACYLHDLVTLPKDHPDRHLASAMSASAAAPILRDLGLSAAQISATQHAITAHSYSANIPPETAEAKILQDADRIEALGAIGLARVFAVSGSLNRPLFHGTDPFAHHRPLDDQTYAVDHFFVKLLALPDTMQTDGGRALAQTRANVLRDYLTTLAAELGTAQPT